MPRAHGKSGLNRRFPSRKWWRRRESNPRPKARRRGTLHACPLPMSHARREEAAKNRRPPAPEHLTIARRAAARSPACLMTFGPQPPGEVKANAHSLIRLRERTENPQLTDVPSDLRVNGARHASRDLEPPSKPNSPPWVVLIEQQTHAPELPSNQCIRRAAVGAHVRSRTRR